MTEKDNQIVRCSGCGAQNRIPPERRIKDAQCGRCGQKLDNSAQQNQALGHFILRCPACRTKNRIPGSRAAETATCGKCQTAIPTDSLRIGESIAVGDRDFDTQILKSTLPVLLLCYATWCPSCQAVTPVVQDLASQWKGRVKTCKMNMDHNPVTSSQLQVMSVPTLLIYDQGQLKDRLVGALPKQTIIAKITPFLY